MSSKTPEEEDDDRGEGRGRSANRREAKTFDVLALKLTTLPHDKTARLPVSEALLASMRNARDTKSKAARRRHLRHFAGMLRTSPSEVEAIDAFLAGRAFTAISGNEENSELEQLREELCVSELFSENLDRASNLFPHLDLLLVRELCTPLHALDKDSLEGTKNYRLLFKELRRAFDAKQQNDDDQ